jgi:6-phosphogluconolactonase
MIIESYPDAASAADAAAEAIVEGLAREGPKRFIATGGKSVGQLYDKLASAELDWARLTVSLTDDRFVAASSADSNERLVRDRLLEGQACVARFVPLKGSGASPSDDAAAAEPKIRALLPFDVVLLGVGEDGHFASLFPRAPELDEALDPAGERLVIGVERAGLPPYVPRISLTLAAILQSRLIVVFAAGEAKRALLQRIADDPAFAPPVSDVLRQSSVPVRVIWSSGP